MSTTASGVPSSNDIRDWVVSGLAEVRGVDRSEVEQELNSTGDIAMDSLEGIAIVAKIEGQVGRELPGTEDLAPDHYTSAESLTRLITEKLGGQLQTKQDSH